MKSIRIIGAADGMPYERWWGDFWVKRYLEEAFLRKGFMIMPNAHASKKNPKPPADIDLFLHARHTYDHLTAKTKIAWICTRQATALTQLEYFKQFDHVFDFSPKPCALNATYLPAGTNFKPGKKVDQLLDVLFIGNARAPRPELLSSLCDHNISLQIYGNGWQNLQGTKAGKHWIGPNLKQESLNDAYRAAKIVLVCHDPEMLESEAVSVKTLDIIASGGFALVDNPGIKRVLDYPTYTSDTLLARVNHFLKEENRRPYLKAKITRTWDDVVEDIIKHAGLC